MPKKFNLESKIKQALRKLSMQWPAVAEVRRRARVAPGIYECEHCGDAFGKLEVNHKNPVVDPCTGFVGYDEYVARLFVGADEMEALCKSCHLAVTADQRALKLRKVD